MSLARSLLGLLAGLALFRLIVTVLETALVGASAGGPVADEAEYFAVRNQPAMLAAALGYNGAAAFLAGYVMTKIARARDVMVAGVAATIETAALTWAFTAGAYAAYTPVWARIAMIALVGPAMVAGGLVCAKAAGLRDL